MGLINMYALGAFVAAYFLGSIPFGLVLTKLSGGPDPRSIGSGNIGATNVLRSGSKALAAGTLLGDMLKGTVAVLIASHYGPDAAHAAGLGAFLGHLFPVWLRGKGGKGVATYIGVLLALAWPAVFVFGVIWIGVAAATRYSSLAGLVASVAGTPVLVIMGQPDDAVLFFILTALMWYMHRANIERLLAGTEGKVGRSA
jgi:acyl phosphate:glycerol-3-phosphate acyltransferase